MKKTAFILSLLLCLLTLLTACGQVAETQDNIVIWTFSDETQKMVNDYITAYPEEKDKVKVYTYPLETFQTKLDGAIRTQKNLPDVIALEIGFVKKYVESGKMLSVEQLGLAEKASEQLYPYLNEVGTSQADGKLYALSSQATPGGFFYRRSIAKALWNDDTPEFVQTKLNDWDAFLATARELKAFNDTRIVSNLNATQKVFKCQRSDGWVKDNTLQIDACWSQYLDQIKTIQAEGLSNETVEYQSGGGWYTDISDDKVFGYFLAAWGLNYHLKTNASTDYGDSTNDWGVVKGPNEYFDGGTWFGALNTTKSKDKVAKLLDYWMFNQDFLQQWATKTLDFSGNKLTVDAVKNQFNDAFLQGQNHYTVFADIARGISGTTITKYDESVGGIFSSLAVAYAMGIDPNYKTLEQVYAKFREQVHNNYTTINVE